MQAFPPLPLVLHVVATGFFEFQNLSERQFVNLCKTLFVTPITVKKDIIILGIESSCDDTSAAISKNGNILANLVANQEIHSSFGGVVPELASRAHQQHIVPVVHQALTTANIDKEELSAVAFTKGPGLLGSLLVGTSFSKAFALGLHIPLIDVNHMQAHVMAHFILEPGKRNPEFPFLCLTVSGGHTEIVLVEDVLSMRVIGRTNDDAVGEAFDKAARILDLPYPGGPLIDKHATGGDPDAFVFPKPKFPDLDYSFSGLKTAFLYFIRDHLKEDPNFVQSNLADICASYQRSLIETVLDKFVKAIDIYKVKHIGIAGGVAANSYLRSRIAQIGEEKRIKVYIPKFEYCTDNAAMIAVTGHYKFQLGRFADHSVTAEPRAGIGC
ncbi:MAG: tRNA (adenosine(37)-N6)-threonylcarbamoyltransferase complex transferase subunit TsaD [Flavobacteriales bacterium]|nr:tRNA (adenosine(37)-N6)-threonylcarbamoyltransferase complex transferase subunit TsaD [Flavobacteriales bacterium]